MEQFLIQNQWIILPLILWVLPWKGLALWKAAKNNHKWWFVALLIVNTLAVLEILYIFIFSKRKPTNLGSGNKFHRLGKNLGPPSPRGLRRASQS